MSDDRIVVTDYVDPITLERRVAYLCHDHDVRALALLRYAGIGSGTTYAPSLASCTACLNQEAQS